MKRRIVVTGIGVIAPNGLGKEAFWEALASGKSGIKRIRRFNVDSYPTQIAGEIQNFNPGDYISPRDIKRTSLATHFAIAAAKLAVEDSRLPILQGDEIGVVMGVSASAADIIESQHTLFMERGLSRVLPYGVLAIVPSSAANNISRLLGCRGAVVTISNSCASGLDAIGYAFMRISYGGDGVIIAGATDSQLTPFGLAMLCAPGIMSKRNDDPERASRPFDKDRDGGILSEGSGIIIVEELEHALSRDARIYAEILGYSSRCDGIIDQETGLLDIGIERTMYLALQNAGISLEEVDYICAHGPSDDFDRIETIAIKRVFGEHAYKIPISSIKSMTGNPLAAAGPFQLAASAMIFERNIIPPTVNLENPDPNCDLDYVPLKARVCDSINIILINSHGFGGVNSSLIIRKYKQE